MNPCIVSFSSHGRENYNAAMLNLIRSIKEIYYEVQRQEWNCDTMMYQFDGYIDEYLGVKIEQGKSFHYPQPKEWQCYNHAEIPYQFKLAMIQRAKDAGHTRVIWCDSTVRLLANPQPLLELAKEHGIVAFENLGHPLEHWISDNAITQLGFNSQTIKGVKQIMACVIIFDFSIKKCREIFEMWVNHSRDGLSFQNYGSTRAGFKAHRHDQAVLSGLLHREGIPLRPYGELVYPPHHETKEYGENIYFLNKGVS